MTKGFSRKRIGNGFWHRAFERAVCVRTFFLGARVEGEDNRRREYILNVILLGSIGILLVMEIWAMWYAVHPTGHDSAGIRLAGFSFFPAFFVGLYVLSRRGFVRIASYALVISLFAGDFYAVCRWGVNVPTAIVGYALIIVIASILIGTRFGFVITVLVAAAVILVWYFQSKGIIVADSEIFVGGDVVSLALMYCVIMVVASLSNREIERSLFRARRSERELKEERDLLEIRVEEKTRDFRKAQFEKVENVHRMAEFGELASGLFHDLVNLVTAILPKADTGQTPDRLASPESRGAELETLTDRVKDFTDGMRRQLHERTEPELFSVDEAIAQAVQLLSYEARREKVQLVFDGTPHARIFGDSFRFHHVATNLIANAIESYRSTDDGRGKTVWISVREAGHSLSVVVRDDGCGMSDDVQKKIFEPFFTTKAGDGGLGIGLAVVRRIVERDFGGTISVTSVVGSGSTFTVVVPLAGAHLEPISKMASMS
jgi:signal transduction histidine kinase